MKSWTERFNASAYLETTSLERVPCAAHVLLGRPEEDMPA